MMDIKGVLLQCFINFFDKEAAGGAVKNKNISKKELAAEVHKSINRKFNLCN